MSELKPCPFCGGVAKVERSGNALGKMFYVACQGEKCTIRPTTDGIYTHDDPGAEKSAIVNWNNRDATELAKKERATLEGVYFAIKIIVGNVVCDRPTVKVLCEGIKSHFNLYHKEG